MILTGAEISKQVRRGDIIICPFSPSHVNPNSYDYRLGPDLIEMVPTPVAPGRWPELDEPMALASQRQLRIGPEGFVLQPGRLYLGRTVEQIGSPSYVTTLIGKSSMGRLGVFLQVDACLGHQGPAHCWTLELAVRVPVRVYSDQVIGQVSFWRTSGKAMPYGGTYGTIDEPTPNRSPAFLAPDPETEFAS